MRLRLATKLSWAILGIVALSIISSGVAWYAAWRVNRRLDLNSKQALPDARVEELAMLVHERNNLIAAYLLDSDSPKWETRLHELQSRFDRWLTAVHAGANAPEQKTLIAQLQRAWEDLDARQNDVIALSKQGKPAAAKTLLLTEINGRLTREIDSLGDQLIAANDANLRGAIARADWRIRLATWVVVVSAVLSLVLGGLLLWLLFYRILYPLRGFVADAQLFRGEREEQGKLSDDDELHRMANYLRNLMSDVNDTRSRLERSRDRLLAAEKLASVGRLAASVAHEIRNPLTAIKMWLFSIRESAEGNGELNRKLGIVSEEIERLESIVRHFLEFSRPPAVQPRPQDTTVLVGQTLEFLAPRLAEARVRLERAPDGNLPPVLADAAQFRQVLINLIGNAIDAMPDGGVLRIQSASEKDPEGLPMVVMRIADTGCGMPPEIQRRVFEPFFTTKETGTGLGLCIAAQVMARHGGALALESSTDRGTTFAIWIPIVLENDHGKNTRR
ncbi:MAG TPA: ATP-binding protein [Pirellulales bacterium]|nr:ATP-binding protein [Pirellulales bacterium]